MDWPLALALLERLPQSATPQSCIAHVTPFFAGSKVTVAAMSCAWPKSTVVLGGVGGATVATETEIAFTTIAVKEAWAAGSATEVAVTVTCTSEGGGVAGAV